MGLGGSRRGDEHGRKSTLLSGLRLCAYAAVKRAAGQQQPARLIRPAASPPLRSTLTECYWTGLRQTRWARAVYAANLGGLSALQRHSAVLQCALSQAGLQRPAHSVDGQLEFWAPDCSEQGRRGGSHIRWSGTPSGILCQGPRWQSGAGCPRRSARAGREYTMPFANVGRHGYKSSIKALCEWGQPPQMGLCRKFRCSSTAQTSTD